MTTNSRRFLMAPDLRGAAWRKSSYSGGNSGQCVEVADLSAAYDGVAIRDSKDPNGPALMFPAGTFTGFIAEVAAGRFDN